MKMLIGDKTKLYHDGKICRDVPAVVLAHRASGIKFKFTLPEWADSKEVVAWSRKRRHGVYEVIGYNFFFVQHHLNYKPE